jgi:hypothetical protein
MVRRDGLYRSMPLLTASPDSIGFWPSPLPRRKTVANALCFGVAHPRIPVSPVSKQATAVPNGGFSPLLLSQAMPASVRDRILFAFD